MYTMFQYVPMYHVLTCVIYIVFQSTSQGQGRGGGGNLSSSIPSQRSVLRQLKNFTRLWPTLSQDWSKKIIASPDVTPAPGSLILITHGQSLRHYNRQWDILNQLKEIQSIADKPNIFTNVLDTISTAIDTGNKQDLPPNRHRAQSRGGGGAGGGDNPGKVGKVGKAKASVGSAAPKNLRENIKNIQEVFSNFSVDFCTACLAVYNYRLITLITLMLTLIV